jgi:hypothetical protein
VSTGTLTQNSGAYAPETLPACGSTTRFALTTSPEGHSSSPATTVGLCFDRLLAQARERSEERHPERRSVRLWFVGRSQETGEFVKVPRGTVVAVPARQGSAPSKHWRSPLRETPALLDDFFLGGGAYSHAPDSYVFDALVSLCEELQPTGEECRQINNRICLLLLLRHGIDLTPAQLPNAGTPHKADEAWRCLPSGQPTQSGRRRPTPTSSCP